MCVAGRDGKPSPASKVPLDTIDGKVEFLSRRGMSTPCVLSECKS